jgi:serine/threonine-protein kinase
VLAARPEPPSVHAPSLPPGLDALVLRCLERDVARRYASVADLAAALAPFAADEEGPVSARRVARVLGASSGPVSNARPSLVSVANEITPTPDVTTLPVPIASAQGTVAVRAWKLWALVAACGVLSVAFAASLVARGSARTAEARGPSADLGEGAGAALPAARPAASAQVDRPTASSSASVAAVDAPMPSAIATAAASSKVAPKPAPARSAKVTAAPPARSVVEEAPKPPPPPPAPVTHRVFGSED